MKPFGLRATESMRIEKGYRDWKADLITEFNPFESALDRFVNLDKDFVGKTALMTIVDRGPRRKIVSMEIMSDVAPAHPGDSIVSNGQIVGTITSASWGHRVGKNLAMGFVNPDCSESGSQFGVEILGETIPAVVCDACLYDPENDQVRGGPASSNTKDIRSRPVSDGGKGRYGCSLT